MGYTYKLLLLALILLSLWYGYQQNEERLARHHAALCSYGILDDPLPPPGLEDKLKVLGIVELLCK